MLSPRTCCCQSVKDKNFESNSQQPIDVTCFPSRCCQSVKDKNFESNSQPKFIAHQDFSVVVSLSKIKISKAIHNRLRELFCVAIVVVSLSKIKISKAIHNIEVSMN